MVRVFGGSQSKLMTNINKLLQAASGVSTATDYQLMSWGKGGDGQLGLGNTSSYSSPKTVGSATPWTKLSAPRHNEGGQNHVAAIQNGKLFTWGDNTDGELGHGNTTAYSSPKQVGALTTWEEVSLGGQTMLAVKKDGTLWACGDNWPFGSLGLGNTTSYSSPVQVGSLTNWSKVSASGSGLQRSAAIKTDGTLWTWGNGADGVTGHGSTSNISSPAQVGALTNWAEVSVGVKHMLAVKTDGTLWAWGKGSYGKLGLDNTTNYSSPVQVGSLTNWATPFAAGYFSAAVKTDGTLWTWGYGSYGKLGHGNTTTLSSPAQVGALTNWSSEIGLWNMGMLAVKTDGTLWSWGMGNYGTLGHNNKTSLSSPAQVGSLTSWKVATAVGYGSSLAFYEP